MAQWVQQKRRPGDRFHVGEFYLIKRRGFLVILYYLGGEFAKDGRKKADVFRGVSMGGTNSGENLYYMLEDGRYATSPDRNKAWQKWCCDKTNVLHGIFHLTNGGIVRV